MFSGKASNKKLQRNIGISEYFVLNKLKSLQSDFNFLAWPIYCKQWNLPYWKYLIILLSLERLVFSAFMCETSVILLLALGPQKTRKYSVLCEGGGKERAEPQIWGKQVAMKAGKNQKQWWREERTVYSNAKEDSPPSFSACVQQCSHYHLDHNVSSVLTLQPP